MPYNLLPKEELEAINVKAHDARALALSWVLHKGVAFKDIIMSLAPTIDSLSFIF